MKIISLYLGLASLFHFSLLSPAATSSDPRVQVIRKDSIETIIYEISEQESVSVWIDDDALINAEKNLYTKDGILSDKWCTQGVSVNTFRDAVDTDLEAFRFALYHVLVEVAVDLADARNITDLIAPLPLLGEEVHKEPLLKIPLSVGPHFLPLPLTFVMANRREKSRSLREGRSSSRSPSSSPSSSPRRRSSTDSPPSDGDLPNFSLLESVSTSGDSPRSASGSPSSSPRKIFTPAARSPRVYFSPARLESSPNSLRDSGELQGRLHKSSDAAE